MRELSSSVIFLLEFVSLDLSAHRTVENDDTLFKYLSEVGKKFFDV
jgi:hypothetical protein